MDYLQVYLIPKCLAIFLLSFSYYLEFDPIVARMHPLYKFNYFNFVEIYFMPPEYSLPSICPMDIYKIYFLLPQGWILSNVNEILLVDDIWVFSCSCWIYVSLLYPFWGEKCSSSNYKSQVSLFAHSVLSVLLHIFVGYLLCTLLGCLCLW